MPQEYNAIIADTTCFILLDKIGELNLLQQLFKQVTTTNIIAKEFGKPFPDWVKIVPVIDTHYQNILAIEVDEGEASAIALALQLENTLLILDDFKARKLANKLQLIYTGTFGVLLKAKQTGAIHAIKPILNKIQATNFRFSETILLQILKEASEE